MHTFEQKLQESWPAKRRSGMAILLAVSGGADSIAMLRSMAMVASKSNLLHVAHFNHGLRGNDADADQAFVEEICRDLGIKCFVGRAGIDSAEIDSKDGVEASARAARYPFLQKTAERIGARYVATAHTADDQVETILHRIIRGTGMRGLAGMQRARKLGEAVTLIRPLLDFTRRELIAYLDDIGQKYREDTTNADTGLTRNCIRHELLPMLVDRFNPAIDRALLRLGSLAGELQTAVGRDVERLFLETVNIAADQQTVCVDAKRLAAASPYLVRETLMSVWRRQKWPMQSMGFEEWSILADMLNDAAAASPRSQEIGRRTLPGNVSAKAQPRLLVLKRQKFQSNTDE